MNIFAIVGLAVTACVLAIALKRYQPNQSLLIGVAATVVIFLMILPSLQPAIGKIEGLMSSAKLDKTYLVILIKSLGICFLAQVASDICRDADESAIATNVEMAGKFSVLIIALPLFGQVADLVIKLLNS